MIRPSSGDLPIPADAAKAAEAAGFEVAYVRHYRDVHRYLLGLTRSVDEADDLAAETFERALRAWAGRPIPDKTLPWLLLTARRLATDRWRRARRLAGLSLEPPLVARRAPANPGPTSGSGSTPSRASSLIASAKCWSSDISVT